MAKERLEEELGSEGGDFRDRRELRMDHRWRGLLERSLKGAGAVIMSTRRSDEFGQGTCLVFEIE